MKPENIMLSRAGRTVIMDFGIARTKKSTRLDGGMSGTPAYMSPEQLGSGPIDGRSDLFSLGVMMFEMLSGKLPFSGDTAMMLALARQLDDAPLLSTLRPDLPASVVQLVARCLARPPEDRFATAEELRRALLSLPLTVDQQSCNAPRQPDRDPDATLLLGGDHRLRAVAVWRLQNQGTSACDHLTDGLADSLTDALGNIRDVRVIPRTALQQQLARSEVPLLAAKQLGAHAFLCGAFSLQGTTLSVTLRLLAVDSGFQLFCRRWELPFGEALSMCQKTAQEIAVALTSEVTAPQSDDVLDPETLNLYLKARQLYTGNDSSFFHHSVELLEQALAQKPNSPLLLVGYAKACARAWFWGHSEDEHKAIRAAQRAVEVAKNQGPPYLALGAACYGTGDLPGSVRALRKGLGIAPQLADCHDLLGRILCECGPLSEAVAHLETASRLDPLSTRPRLEMARLFAMTGAWKQVDSLLEQELNDPRAVPLWWMITGRMALWRKDPAWAKQKLTMPGDESVGCQRGKRLLRVAASEDGSASLSDDEFRQLFEAGSSANPRRRVMLHQGRTELLCFEQKREAALLSLADCVEDGLCDVMWIDLCPLLELLRDEPRFVRLRQVVEARASQIRAAMETPLP
ncbi:MAG TPA: protein kinase [Pseudomonadota bacterium]|nr:protein kinase [Pseudomonadota bacterium]